MNFETQHYTYKLFPEDFKFTDNLKELLHKAPKYSGFHILEIDHDHFEHLKEKYQFKKDIDFGTLSFFFKGQKGYTSYIPRKEGVLLIFNTNGKKTIERALYKKLTKYESVSMRIMKGLHYVLDPNYGFIPDNVIEETLSLIIFG